MKEFPVTAGALLQRKLGTVNAVSDVSFAVREGETFGLVGESGLRQDHDRPARRRARAADSGAIIFEGEDLSSMRGTELRRERSATCSSCSRTRTPRSTPGCASARSLREPLVDPGHRQPRRAAGSGSRELLDEVGLAREAAELYPHEFSGGQRQRIGLARALALNPKLIVADEPVSALDVSIQAQILNLMRALQDRHGLTYVVISHDLAVVKYLADRIGVMYLGKLVEIGAAEEVYEHAAHPYTRGLIDTIPVPDPVASPGRRPASLIKRRAAVGDRPAVGLPLPDPVPLRAGDLRRRGARAAARSARATSPPATSRCSPRSPSR